MTDGDLLRRAAERASQHPYYLASSLLAYAGAERIDDAELANRLGCDLASLPALLLCRRPTGEGAMFRADIEVIAERFALNAMHLAQVIRAADALVSLGSAPMDQTGGLLAAARDRDADDSGRSLHAPLRPGDRPFPDAQPDEDAP